ncbi:MAG: hypothetical protein K2K57_03610 [Oscillospiraceae bacterium]|nr:hypothetical protein [Oscillospiraceae bacterium]
MFEQDYVMRQIKEMVRAFLKLLFNIETDEANVPITELPQDRVENELLKDLLDMVDSGNINEAENRLYNMLENNSSLKTALLFYSYLNDKTDEFLSACSFSREEIVSGLDQIIDRYDLHSLSKLILSEL